MSISKKVKTAVVSVALGSVVVLGGSAPAQAATTYYNDCHTVAGARGWYSLQCRVDYNWFEEMFQGKRDGYMVWKVYDNKHRLQSTLPMP